MKTKDLVKALLEEDPSGEKAEVRAKNNGFNRMIEITPEFRTFLELAPDEEISRSIATRKLNEYIDKHHLKNPDNGRIIMMDDKLKALISPGDGVEVTFLNMQKHMSKHYVKPEKPAKPEKPKKEKVVVEAAAPGTEEVVPKPKRVVVRKPKA